MAVMCAPERGAMLCYNDARSKWSSGMPDLTAQVQEFPADEHEPRGRLAMRTLWVLLLPIASVLITGILL